MPLGITQGTLAKALGVSRRRVNELIRGHRGITPDTFTDSVEVVVEGRLQKDGAIHATDVLAKCGSRYEAVPKAT